MRSPPVPSTSSRVSHQRRATRSTPGATPESWRHRAAPPLGSCRERRPGRARFACRGSKRRRRQVAPPLREPASLLGSRRTGTGPRGCGRRTGEGPRGTEPRRRHVRPCKAQAGRPFRLTPIRSPDTVLALRVTGWRTASELPWVHLRVTNEPPRTRATCLMGPNELERPFGELLIDLEEDKAARA